jgi:aryl-alcohol dehydrogenase-like predicted oxidoreductase
VPEPSSGAAEGTLRTRQLGRTKVSLTELTLGTWGLADGAYGPVSDATFEATVAAALERGIRSFDMAPSWGEGRAESTIARVVGDRRDECTYITRVGVHRGHGAVELRMDPTALIESLERSLRRLETRYVDVVLLHDPPERLLLTGTWAKALAQAVDRGLARSFGVSCATASQARVAVALGAEVIAVPYSILRTDELGELEETIESSGVGVLARSPLLHGLATGKIELGHTFAPDDHRAARWTPRALDRRVRQAHALRFLVQGEVSSLRAAALRYVLANDDISSVLLGPRSPEHLAQLVDDAGLPPYLPPDLRERVTQLP